MSLSEQKFKYCSLPNGSHVSLSTQNTNLHFQSPPQPASFREKYPQSNTVEQQNYSCSAYSISSQKRIPPVAKHYVYLSPHASHSQLPYYSPANSHGFQPDDYSPGAEIGQILKNENHNLILQNDMLKREVAKLRQAAKKYKQLYHNSCMDLELSRAEYQVQKTQCEEMKAIIHQHLHTLETKTASREIIESERESEEEPQQRQRQEDSESIIESLKRKPVHSQQKQPRNYGQDYTYSTRTQKQSYNSDE